MTFSLLAHYLRPGVAAQIGVSIDDPGPGGYDSVALSQKIAALVNLRSYGMFPIGEAVVHVFPYLASQPFWPAKASYQLTIVQRHNKNEQARFRTKIAEAAENLLAHAPPSTSRSMNAIFIRVPPPISMAEAIEATRDLLSARFADVSTVFLNRTQLFLPGTGGPAQMGHEYQRVDNPLATYRAPELLIELPIGTAIGEPQVSVSFGGTAVNSRESYIFSRASRFHYSKAKGHSVTFRIEPRFTEDVTIYSHPAGREMNINHRGFPNWTLIL